MTLPAHRLETTLEKDGKLALENLPFRAGQAVEVIILSLPVRERPANPNPLRGTTGRYERPTEPVAEQDWESTQ